jgi:hypothetical protein
MVAQMLLDNVPFMSISWVQFFEMPLFPPGISFNHLDPDDLTSNRVRLDRNGVAPRLWDASLWKEKIGGKWYIFKCYRAHWNDRYVEAELFRPKIRVKANSTTKLEKLSEVQQLKIKIKALRTELANAQLHGEYKRAGELAYERIPELEGKLRVIEAA